MKRNFQLLLLSFVVFVVFLVTVFVYTSGSFKEHVVEKSASWEYKEEEIRSRLLDIPILLYHNIDGKGIFSIDQNNLRAHFQMFYDNGINVVKLSDLIERLENPEPFNSKVLVITFDDGFYSAYDKLMPLAKEFGYPVTLFVYTDNIYVKAKNSLTWKKLEEMEVSGIDIQCHSISHLDLSKLSRINDIDSQQKLFSEIYLAKRIMELYLDKEIQYYAFPYGRYDPNIVQMCREIGYRRVFSTDYGSNVITRNNYCLRRQHIKKNYTPEYILGLIN